MWLLFVGLTFYRRDMMNTISGLGKEDGFQRIVGLILQIGGRKEKLKVSGIGSC